MRILFRGRRNICWCWTVTSVAPRNVNDVSCITRINHENAFWRQTQYLAMLEGNFCCSAQCKRRFMWPGSIIESPFSWQAQYLVMLEGNLCCSAQFKNDTSRGTRINHENPFSRQTQYLMMLECNLCCSAQCKWRFMCDQDQSWESFFAAGALFGDVGG